MFILKLNFFSHCSWSSFLLVLDAMTNCPRTNAASGSCGPTYDDILQTECQEHNGRPRTDDLLHGPIPQGHSSIPKLNGPVARKKFPTVDKIYNNVRVACPFHTSTNPFKFD